MSSHNYIGATESTHVIATMPRWDAAAYNGRKHYTSHNMLATVDLDLKFTYVLACWEGSADGESIHAQHKSI